MSTMSKNPFDIAEIRSRVAQLVSVKGALSCIRVSKAFSLDFVGTIWHTVDFELHGEFDRLEPVILRKNGHLVRVAKNVKNQDQVDSLLCLGASKISILNIAMARDAGLEAGCYDLIRRNHRTLIELQLKNANGSSRGTSLFIFLDSLTLMTPISSKLTSLAIRWLSITRESFTSTLRCCPALIKIDLWGTTVTRHRSFDEYQHTGVTFLQAMIVDVVEPGSLPLFIHFPNLEHWATGHDSRPSEFPTLAVKDGVSIWCPQLKGIETNFTPSPLLCHLLVNVFVGLTSLTFGYSKISSDIIMAILRYPATWRAIVAYAPRSGFKREFEEDGFPETVDHFQSSGWMIQLLPRLCHRLTTFEMVEHEMNVDEIEQAPWLCTDLEYLAVRIQGLDTREKVEGVIVRWREGRKQRKLGLTVEAPVEEDGSIEARVARHLLRFKSLSTVWLGSKMWKALE